MKPPKFLLIALLVVAFAVTAFTAETTSESQNQAYHEYLETYRKTEAAYQAAYQKDARIRNLIALAVLAGLIVFIMVPVRRASKRALELNEQQQKTLEEIRDLLKNNDT